MDIQDVEKFANKKVEAMDGTKRQYYEELLSLSIQACQHEDSLLLLLALNDNKPLSPEELLNRINKEFRRHAKLLWTPDDLEISWQLLLQHGMIEPGT